MLKISSDDAMPDADYLYDKSYKYSLQKSEAKENPRKISTLRGLLLEKRELTLYKTQERLTPPPPDAVEAGAGVAVLVAC